MLVCLLYADSHVKATQARNNHCKLPLPAAAYHSSSSSASSCIIAHEASKRPNRHPHPSTSTSLRVHTDGSSTSSTQAHVSNTCCSCCCLPPVYRCSPRHAYTDTDTHGFSSAVLLQSSTSAHFCSEARQQLHTHVEGITHQLSLADTGADRWACLQLQTNRSQQETPKRDKHSRPRHSPGALCCHDWESQHRPPASIPEACTALLQALPRSRAELPWQERAFQLWSQL